MAKSHYSIKKRKKELARKLKQEEKRQRKLNKDKIKPEENPDKSQGEIKNLQAYGCESVFTSGVKTTFLIN